MLNKRENLEPALVDAHKRTLMVMKDSGFPEPCRFDVIQDSQGYHVGAVSGRYKLIRNADLIGAIDLASDSLDVPLTVGQCRYQNGRTSLEFTLPDTYRVTGDPSDIKPLIRIGNDYGGGGALTGAAGVYRLVCTNGMMIGKVETYTTLRHVGEIDLYEFTYGLVNGLVKRAQVHKIIAESTQEMPFEWAIKQVEGERVDPRLLDNAQLLNTIAENTPPRYHQPLRDAITRNREDIGRTVWALLQSISEVSTHNMRGWAAQNWQRRETNRVLEHVNIAVEV